MIDVGVVKDIVPASTWDPRTQEATRHTLRIFRPLAPVEIRSLPQKVAAQEQAKVVALSIAYQFRSSLEIVDFRYHWDRRGATVYFRANDSNNFDLVFRAISDRLQLRLILIRVD
jgi:hypothetical protein